MDFLDPRKRRAHSIRLMVGYALMAIAIGLGAIILVYGAYGYGINTKTGDIIQNGLLFVDSQPGAASIFLNDKPQGSTTAARLILPAGSYKLTLKKAGYHDWQRSFTLTEHSIARYVYPLLFPLNPRIKALKDYSTAPPFISQSPDHHWLLAQSIPKSGSGVSFDQFDTTDLTKSPKTLTLPPALITNAPGSSLEEVEWSSDNKHLLLEHVFQGGNEFIIFNRDSPAESINVNSLFKVAPSQVALRNKKTDRLYIFNQKTGDLEIGNTSNSTLSPLLKQVLAFKPYGNNLITYVTNQKSSTGQVQARIWDSAKSYPLYTFTEGDKYLIDAAQFQGHFYYIAGSDTDTRVNLYKDPLNGIKDPALQKAIPLLSLNIKGTSKAAFSVNARFVEAEAGEVFSVYDMETQSAYHFSLKDSLSENLHWMDGHRLIGMNQGKVFITDYDSTNQQLLVPTVYSKGGFFDRGYIHLFTFAPTKKGVSLESVDLRAGSDLPK